MVVKAENQSIQQIPTAVRLTNAVSSSAFNGVSQLGSYLSRSVKYMFPLVTTSTTAKAVTPAFAQMSYTATAQVGLLAAPVYSIIDAFSNKVADTVQPWVISKNILDQFNTSSKALANTTVSLAKAASALCVAQYAFDLIPAITLPFSIEFVAINAGAAVVYLLTSYLSTKAQHKFDLPFVGEKAQEVVAGKISIDAALLKIEERNKDHSKHEEYKQKVKIAIAEKADLSREDLLEALCGTVDSKGLLDYYGFNIAKTLGSHSTYLLVKESKKKGIFEPFIYALWQTTPSRLEAEIRNDLKEAGHKLPAPVYPENEPAAPEEVPAAAAVPEENNLPQENTN